MTLYQLKILPCMIFPWQNFHGKIKKTQADESGNNDRGQPHKGILHRAEIKAYILMTLYQLKILPCMIFPWQNFHGKIKKPKLMNLVTTTEDNPIRVSFIMQK
jgi:hypothetical protein